MSHRILYILNSPSDITPALRHILSLDGEPDISVLCISCMSLPEKFKRNILNSQIEFVQPAKLSDGLFSFPWALRRQRKLAKRLLSNFDLVCFGSYFNDLFTAAFVEEALKAEREVILFSDQFNILPSLESSQSLGRKTVHWFLGVCLSYLTGARIRVIKYNAKLVPWYIPRTVVPEFNSDYVVGAGIEVEFSPRKGRKNIIYFDCPGSEHALKIKDYSKALQRVLTKLSEEADIYVKAHPNYPLSSSFNSNDAVFILAEKAPASFLNLDAFDAIYSIDSAALKEANHHTVVSVVESFTFESQNSPQFVKKYLTAASRNEIIFEGPGSVGQSLKQSSGNQKIRLGLSPSHFYDFDC